MKSIYLSSYNMGSHMNLLFNLFDAVHNDIVNATLELFPEEFIFPPARRLNYYYILLLLLSMRMEFRSGEWLRPLKRSILIYCSKIVQLNFTFSHFQLAIAMNFATKEPKIKMKSIHSLNCY